MKRIYNPLGLGDLLHYIFYPFAVLLGRTDCATCNCRCRSANDIVPNVNPVSIAYRIYWSWQACSKD